MQRTFFQFCFLLLFDHLLQDDSYYHDDIDDDGKEEEENQRKKKEDKFIHFHISVCSHARRLVTITNRIPAMTHKNYNGPPDKIMFIEQTFDSNFGPRNANAKVFSIRIDFWVLNVGQC